MAYALSPAGPVYSGPGASPTQATAEPFTADSSPYFPFNARPGSRLSPAKAKIIPVSAAIAGAGLRPTKEEPTGTPTTLEGHWGVYGSDEFAQDSPRYTSPGAAGPGYYLGGDGTPNSAVGAEWPNSYPTSYQTYEAYGLIPESEAGQGLPPMSSLRPNGTPTATTLTGTNTATPFGPPSNHDVVNKGLGGVSETDKYCYEAAQGI
ncbi:hypothetical protein JTB14_017431 [Gonioctena quinquepunctata]|nr:hypothetical protein JTB14_017431 [Gonioctena quinquepunctata]